MISYAELPTLNAALNSLCAFLLITGRFFISRNDVRRHRFCMVLAFIISCLFLISYLTYHAHVGSVRFQGQGIIRTLYFTLLLSHTVLAASIVPLVLRTLYLALRSRFDAHRAWARWTYPLWLYVSVTGVVIYEMLY